MELPLNSFSYKSANTARQITVRKGWFSPISDTIPSVKYSKQYKHKPKKKVADIALNKILLKLMGPHLITF